MGTTNAATRVLGRHVVSLSNLQLFLRHIFFSIGCSSSGSILDLAHRCHLSLSNEPMRTMYTISATKRSTARLTTQYSVVLPPQEYSRSDIVIGDNPLKASAQEKLAAPYMAGRALDGAQLAEHHVLYGSGVTQRHDMCISL